MVSHEKNIKIVYKQKAIVDGIFSFFQDNFILHDIGMNKYAVDFKLELDSNEYHFVKYGNQRFYTKRLTTMSFEFGFEIHDIPFLQDNYFFMTKSEFESFMNEVFEIQDVHSLEFAKSNIRDLKHLPSQQLYKRINKRLAHSNFIEIEQNEDLTDPDDMDEIIRQNEEMGYFYDELDKKHCFDVTIYPNYTECLFYVHSRTMGKERLTNANLVETLFYHTVTTEYSGTDISFEIIELKPNYYVYLVLALTGTRQNPKPDQEVFDNPSNFDCDDANYYRQYYISEHKWKFIDPDYLTSQLKINCQGCGREYYPRQVCNKTCETEPGVKKYIESFSGV
jgi:hypothetical protein